MKILDGKHMKTLNEYMMQASNFHPIKLDEYLSTKIKNMNVLDEFPKIPATEDVIDWLERRGYKKNEKYEEYLTDVYKGKIVPKENEKYWNYDTQVKGHTRIMFFSGSELSEKNPAFMLITNEKGNVDYSNFWPGYKDWYQDRQYYDEYKDLRNEINRLAK